MKQAIQNIAALIQRERRSSEARNIADTFDDPIQTIVQTYLAEQAESDPVLFVHDSGDVILWASEEDAENDDGSRALNRWSVSPEVADALAPLEDA